MLNEIWEHYLIVHKRLHQRPKYSHLFVQFFLFFCVNHFAFTFSSLRRSVLPTKSCQTPKRRSFTTDMANRVYGREEGEGPAWTTSSPIFLVGGCLVSWGGRAEDEMEERGEARTWCILWSKCAFLWQIGCFEVLRYILLFCHTEFLLKTSTMAKPPNSSSVRMLSVERAMGNSSCWNHKFPHLIEPNCADALRFCHVVREVRQEQCRSVWRAEGEAWESWWDSWPLGWSSRCSQSAQTAVERVRDPQTSTCGQEQIHNVLPVFSVQERWSMRRTAAESVRAIRCVRRRSF